MQERLVHIEQIQASDGAFAAIRSDGAVVTWGDVDSGGSLATKRISPVDLFSCFGPY